MDARNNTVLIIGGGVAGIKTAMDLSELGRNVLLIDKEPSIGGLMTQLDRTFPTNNCDLCTLSPQLSEHTRQHHIELMPLTMLSGLAGEAGRFEVTLSRAPRYIDADLCTACGQCYRAFPDCVSFRPGLDHRAPTCMRYPQATPFSFSIDLSRCKDIDGLAASCPVGAIRPQDRETEERRTVGAVVVAVGADLFNPGDLDHFGYRQNSDVVTGLEYERILSASGPTGGDLVRPSDGKPPKRIAWIQCAGSRGINRCDVSYCSSVCCMYALKEAIVTKERFQDDIEATIFYMDMRTFGKDYERYYERAQSEYDVRLVRCRPHSVVPDHEAGALSVSYLSDENPVLKTDSFDMVVLSTGFRPSAESSRLAGLLGIELNRHQFVATQTFHPVETSRPGIYVCGVFESPKDIPETMVQASAAASLAAARLGVEPAAAPEPEPAPVERDVRGEEPKIGVFVCDCGQNIGGVIDVRKIVQDAALLPGVVVAENAGHGCSREAAERIVESIQAHRLNRVVIGGCSPRTHEAMFQSVLQKAGLNKYLLEIANIRDQNTWVHADEPTLALEKAKEQMRMAIGAVAAARPLKDHLLPMNKDVLVLGGGVTGMTAALSLADQGHRIVLAERSGALGGMAAGIRRTIEGEDVRKFVASLVEQVRGHERIEVLLNAILVDHTGLPGMFTTGFQIGPRMYYRQITYGAAIIATGALPHRPDRYLLGRHSSVMTQMDLDRLIEDEPEKAASWKSVVMIQCVGSRTPENPNCSRICCQTAVKNALRILDRNPDTQVFILYRDLRTFGFSEDYALESRARGVIFVRYSAESPPTVTAGEDGVEVVFRDPVIGRDIAVTTECLALSTGMVADDEATEELAAILHINRTADGFFLEDHVKLKPVDMSVPGFFIAGAAHSPKGIRDSISQAQAAAGRAKGLLARDAVNLGAAVARVDKEKCATCLVCVRACPYGVPFINEDRCSEIDPAKCHGCGTCAAECPARAIQLSRFEDEPIMAKLEALLERIA